MSPPYQSSKWPHNKWKRNFTPKGYVWTTFPAIPKWILTVPLFDQSQIFLTSSVRWHMWMSKRKHCGQFRGKYCENIEDTPGGKRGEHCLHWLSITQSFNQWFIFPEGINFFQHLPGFVDAFFKSICTFISRVFVAYSHWTLVQVGPNKVGDLQPESCCLPHRRNYIIFRKSFYVLTDTSVSSNALSGV